MAAHNRTHWTESALDIQGPTQSGVLQTGVGYPGEAYTGVPDTGAAYTGVEPMGYILTVGSMLIISTNLLVGVALLQLVRKKGGQSWGLVLNLALADALVGVSIVGIASGVINASASPPSQARCLLRMAFLTSTSAASILSMFLISLDRYVAIKLPLQYARLAGARVTAGALAALWLLAFAVGFLPGAVEGMRASGYDGSCTFFSVVEPTAIILVFCTGFYPVLSVFIYFYLDILRIACAHQRQIGSRLPRPGRHGGHVKALRTVALLVGCFTLSWSPFFIASTVQVLCRACELHQLIQQDLWLLGLSNSLLNPLVYACWQREVRLELCALLSSVKSRLAPAVPPAAHRGRHADPTGRTQTPALSESRSASAPELRAAQPQTDAPAVSSATL
ncbi:glucose-dependent insulinotropic receptor [Conger conger]|uniref:glucose-dependent insulinotropic receptor n=1 Tax=Conger conger TaxID=82655 RepID=UPI002A5989D3|nr:glucose-dependent insulinotropic receptor [Conger conger]